MANMDSIKKLIDAEIDKIASMPSLTDAAVCTLDKLIDIKKDINELEDHDMVGYSQRAYGLYYDDGMRNNNSYRMPMYPDRHYDRGRDMYDRGRSYNDGYSGDERMAEHLRKAMDMAQDETDREAIRKLMSKIGV